MADEGLEPLVSALEGEIRDFRRVTIGSFNALRDDLVDLRAEMRSGFEEMRSKFDLTATGQQQISGHTADADRPRGSLTGGTP